MYSVPLSDLRPLKNISRIRTHHHSRWRATESRPSCVRHFQPLSRKGSLTWSSFYDKSLCSLIRTPPPSKFNRLSVNQGVMRTYCNRYFHVIMDYMYWVWLVCLFGVFRSNREFYTEDVTIIGDGLQMLTYALHLRPLSIQWGFSSVSHLLWDGTSWLLRHFSCLIQSKVSQILLKVDQHSVLNGLNRDVSAVK